MIETVAHSRYGKISLLDSGGEGVPLLMLHGTGASKQVFLNQLDSPIAKNTRLIAMDFPGHGRSDAASEPDQAYTLEGLANAVIDLLDGLGISQVAILGWSLGGHVAIELLRNHRERLAGIMLTGTPIAARGTLGALYAFHFRTEMLFASKTKFTASETERYARLCYGENVTQALIDDIERCDGRCRPVIARSLLASPSQQAVVTASPLPVAVVNGALEPIARLGHLEDLRYRNLWRGKCHTVAGAGHSPFLQKPGAFNALLQNFVLDIAAGAGGHAEVKLRASA